jgi:ribose transport system permease protein
MISESAPRGATRLAINRVIRGFDWRAYVTYFAFVAVFLFFAITLADRGFLTSNNLLNVFRQTTMITVMAVAMAFVIGAAQIDLSVGAVAGLASVTTAMAISNFGVAPGIAVGVLTGLIVGMINGSLVAFLGIPSFLVTLGMLGVAHGTAKWITDTAPQPIREDSYTNVFGAGDLGPVPSLAIWTITAVVLGHIVLRKTPYGRRVLATGGNRVAAAYSGVNTRRITFLVLTVMGTVAAVGGMLYAGRLHSARFTIGEGDELLVIAAVILGGTSLFGGRASVIGALLGSLMIGLINNGLTLMNLDPSHKEIILGAVIVLAVALARRN